MLTKSEIDQAISAHNQQPHLRELQKLLAKEVTTMVHGEGEYRKAVDASQILFGESTSDKLKSVDEATFLSVFNGVPGFEIDKNDLPVSVIDLLSVKTTVFPSKGECRKMIQARGVSVNKERVESPEIMITAGDLLNEKYILVQKGKKNYYILKIK
jgi:tyrosyl-tRNA synthetase